MSLCLRDFTCLNSETILKVDLSSSVSEDYMNRWKTFCDEILVDETKQYDIFTEWKSNCRSDSNKRLRINHGNLETFLDESRYISLIPSSQSGEIRMKICNGNNKWFHNEVTDLLNAFVKTCNTRTNNFLCTGQIYTQ